MSRSPLQPLVLPLHSLEAGRALSENLLHQVENADFTEDFIGKTDEKIYISQCSGFISQIAIRFLFPVLPVLFSAVGLLIVPQSSISNSVFKNSSLPATMILLQKKNSFFSPLSVLGTSHPQALQSGLLKHSF